MAIDTLRNAAYTSLSMVYFGLSYAVEVANDLKPLATASMKWAYSTASASLGSIGSHLPSIFTSDKVQKIQDFAIRFFTSSDPSITWGTWQIPTFSVLQARSGDMAFVGVTTCAIAKLGFHGLQNIYTAAQKAPVTSIKKTVLIPEPPLPEVSDSQQAAVIETQAPVVVVHPFIHNIQRLGLLIKGATQLGIAGLAAYTFYYHTDNHKRVTDLFLSTIRREM